MTGLVQRPRRLRREPLRRLVRETRLTPESLIAPLFVTGGDGVERPLAGIPGGQVRSVDRLAVEVERLAGLGIGGVLLFGVPEADGKDDVGSAAWDPEGPVPRGLRAVRAASPGISVWADVCLCAYTSHGHCGVLAEDGAGVDNDNSLPLLGRVAATYAEAGADVVAPSDMMDGRVAAIRCALDRAGARDTAICSYAAKYASAFYGPFRDAAGSAPTTGDRRGYQMDPANSREALREVALDLAEGADLVLVKPALAYLDVICRVRPHVDVPLVAYNVSGECAMIEAAAASGWLDRRSAALEVLLAIRRAGADLICTYFAGEAAQWLD